MSTATLAGLRVTSARVSVPAWGAWWAECQVDEESSLAGSVTLQVGDLTMVGTVVSGGPAKGSSAYRVVGGSGGWARRIPAKGYANDAGVRASLVLADAATEAGETLAGDVPTDSLGVSWGRPAGMAVRVLELVAPRGWYVHEDGTTRIGRRPTTAPPSDLVAGPVDTAAARVQVASESPASLLPGVVVDGFEAVDVLLEVSAGAGLRVTLWGEAYSPGQVDAAFLAYVDRLMPWLRYARGPHEYRVVDQEGERLTIQPVRVASGMPDLERVSVMGGLPGARADVQLGSRVLVAFVECDPGRPVVTAFEGADGNGFAATRLDLSDEDDIGVDPSDSIGRVVRYGDPIVFASPGPGVVSISAPSPLSRVRA
jgi:hypothetical protein